VHVSYEIKQAIDIERNTKVMFTQPLLPWKSNRYANCLFSWQHYIVIYGLLDSTLFFHIISK